MLELVVFDVDGLMIDTESVWKDAFDVVGNKYGISNLGDANLVMSFGWCCRLCILRI